VREELREENERIKNQDRELKKAFEKYQSEMSKL
jgi:hypothetical protein